MRTEQQAGRPQGAGDMDPERKQFALAAARWCAGRRAPFDAKAAAEALQHGQACRRAAGRRGGARSWRRAGSYSAAWPHGHARRPRLCRRHHRCCCGRLCMSKRGTCTPFPAGARRTYAQLLGSVRAGQVQDRLDVRLGDGRHQDATAQRSCRGCSIRLINPPAGVVSSPAEWCASALLSQAA